jgi:hypothetical protein
LDTEYLDDDFVSGVMPVLFAADIAAARQAMSVNITPLRKDLDKINRMFFTPESVDLEGAYSIIRIKIVSKGYVECTLAICIKAKRLKILVRANV